MKREVDDINEEAHEG